ncbi:MAG: hypothetical protein Q4F79_10510 [Eubacteriales bacterium]|nr:hypothetical protein [Eubacteriales bacterium]
MKIAAMMKDDGCIAGTTAEATKILLVTEEARIPTAKEVLDIGGQEITSVVLKLAAQNVDVFLAGEMSTLLQSTLRMLGISLYPGCEGDAIEQIAAYLTGEIVGDPSKIVIPEEDENDPMACIHDCAKCMSNCSTRPEEPPLQ